MNLGRLLLCQLSGLRWDPHKQPVKIENPRDHSPYQADLQDTFIGSYRLIACSVHYNCDTFDRNLRTYLFIKALVIIKYSRAL